MKNQVTPEQMTVICNIQMMWEKIGIPVSTSYFNDLCKRNYNDLIKKQNAVLIAYNKTFEK